MGLMADNALCCQFVQSKIVKEIQTFSPSPVRAGAIAEFALVNSLKLEVDIL